MTIKTCRKQCAICFRKWSDCPPGSASYCGDCVDTLKWLADFHYEERMPKHLAQEQRRRQIVACYAAIVMTGGRLFEDDHQADERRSA